MPHCAPWVPEKQLCKLLCPMSAVAIAIARLLVDHLRNFRGQLVGVNRIRVLRVIPQSWSRVRMAGSSVPGAGGAALKCGTILRFRPEPWRGYHGDHQKQRRRREKTRTPCPLTSIRYFTLRCGIVPRVNGMGSVYPAPSPASRRTNKSSQSRGENSECGTSRSARAGCRQAARSPS